MLNSTPTNDCSVVSIQRTASPANFFHNLVGVLTTRYFVVRTMCSNEKQSDSNSSLNYHQHQWEIGQSRVTILQAPPGLEKAINLLFTNECLEFLVKLVDKFEEQVNKVKCELNLNWKK